MSGNKEPCLGVKGLRGEQNSCTYAHTAGERSHITLSFIFYFFSDLKIDNTCLDRRDISHEGLR